MAINLETLSPKELQALIADAQSQMQAARTNHVKDVRGKIDALLARSGLSIADVYPTRKSGKGGPKSVVAPKYRNPQNPSQTWSGRGKRPLWFVDALKRRGVTAEDLLIDATAKAPAPAAKAAGKTAKRAAKTSAKKASSKKAAKS